MKFIPVRWIPDPKVIEFLNDIEKVDIPENKRGILEMISCAFNPYERPPVCVTLLVF